MIKVSLIIILTTFFFILYVIFYVMFSESLQISFKLTKF